jgi:cell surface protein SprA
VDSLSSNFLLVRLPKGISAFQDRAILKNPATTLEQGAIFDTTLTTVRLVQRIKSTNLLQPTVLLYDEYKELRLSTDRRNLFVEESRKKYKEGGRADKSGEGIAIDVPFKIKSKTFKRLFGGDNIGLRVSGNIGITGNIRRQKFDQLQTANQQNANTSFEINMTQQFSISGKVGQKVEVKVDQNSESLFDFQNSIRLTYTGDDDEIVQKVEAGNVQLNLGTKLATFSGKNTGLFGLKTQLKMGALSLTGIASLERGQKNRKSPNKDLQRQQFDEKAFLQGVYFWITSNHVDITDTVNGTPRRREALDFRENYRRYSNRQHVTLGQPGYAISDNGIEVYVTIGANASPTETEIFGPAAAIQFISSLADTQNFPQDQNHVTGVWKRLNKGTDYDVEPQLGYIRLKQPVRSDQALACAFKTDSGGTFGTLQATLNNLALVLLKPPNPQPTDSTWNLMFRHVYSLRATNLDPSNFKLTIIRASSANAGRVEETSPPGQNVSYLQFFDFDREGQQGAPGADGLVDNVPAIIRYDLGELHFLDLTPFNPSGYEDPPGNSIAPWPLATLEQETGDSTGFRAPYLYTTIPTQHNSQGSRWTFKTEYKGSTTEFNLGYLILEGSEEVTLNGAKLTKGIDYTVDYSSGQLKILNEAAKAPGANLEITYESGQAFQLDKKTLLGARAEYELWDNSYIGGMLLYLNEKTLEKRVRIGNEPLRNSLYDLNTSLTFKPYFLTTMVDKVPLITTNSPSELKIEAEMAKVFPNPNSLENPRTGDYNGLADLDDFEGSRRATPLGMLRRMWTVSSIPEDDQIEMLRGRLRWWNPNTREQVPVKEVFPEREVNSQVANTLQSLVLEFTPDSSHDDPDSTWHKERSWGGVMRYLGEAYSDQSRAQFLEFWIKLPPTPEGRLVVDLGEISEDALPNGLMNSEDRPNSGQSTPSQQREYGNGLLDGSDEDTGLDGQRGADPTDSAEWNGPTRPRVPSYDDWAHASNSSDFRDVNGTENSRNDEGGTFPDTEDLNDNDFLDIANRYFSFNIELNENSPYIVGGQDNVKRWRLFRIPLNATDTTLRREVHGPDLTSIRWARLYMTGVTKPTKLEIVQMDIVSNEWLPSFMWQASSGSADTTEYVSLAVINNHENPGYVSPPGVEGDIDPITNIRKREQSLVLHINQLGAPAPDSFFVAKNLYQDISLLEYRRLKMFVHGGSVDASLFPTGKYQFVLRLGQNISSLHNNYYDIELDVKPGWHPDNVINVAMNDLSNLFILRGIALSQVDSDQQQQLRTGRFAWASDTTQFGDSLVIQGNPSLSHVGFMALGIRKTQKYSSSGRDDEIWVDELRVSDIYKDPGTAADVSVSLKLADLATINTGYTTRDADFHNVNTRIGDQASRETKRAGINLALDKFYVGKWGVSLPVTFNYTETNSTPKFIPQTDTRITAETAPDSVKSVQKSYTYTTSFRKTGNSKNPFVRWTVEKLNADYNFNHDEGHDFSTVRRESETSGAGLGYNFPTAKGRGVPFIWWVKHVPVLKILGNPKFYFKPTKLQVQAHGDKRNSYTEQRTGRQDSTGHAINQITESRTFTTSRTLATGFAPFAPINIDFNRTHRGNLASGDWAKLLQYDFGRTSDVQQTVTNTYSPEFFSWLKPTANYTATYGWNWQNIQRTNGQAISNQRNFGVDTQLDFRSILGGGGAERGRSGRDEAGRSGGGRDRAQGERGDERARDERDGRGKEAKTDTTAADTSKAAAPKTPAKSPLATLFSFLSPLKKALTKLDPIAISYDNTAGHQQSGLYGQAKIPYQLGFTMDPGLGIASDTTSGGYTTQPQRRKGQDITARSGVRILQNVKATFNHTYRTAENISTTSTGNKEQTMFWLGKKAADLKAYPFVDVSLDWSGLEKMKFLDKVASSVTVTSGLANKVKENWTGSSANTQSREYTRQWNPLLGVNFSWKGNIESQLRYMSSRTFVNGVALGNKNRNTEQTAQATVSYSIRTGLKIPLLFMRAIRLQNQTTFSLNFDYTTSKQEQTDQPDSETYAVRAAQSSWSVQPRMTYSFSSAVQGEAHLKLQQTKNDVTDSKSRLFEFGIQVNIAIRG